MHLAGVGPEAPVLDEPLPTLGLVLEPLVLLPPMLEPPEVELPVLPEVPPAAAPPTLEPDEAPVEPELPEPEPELCARVAVESARSAAAVAAVIVFNIMCDLLEMDEWTAAAHARKACAQRATRVHTAKAL